jgi:hypothetical protein
MPRGRGFPNPRPLGICCGSLPWVVGLPRIPQGNRVMEATEAKIFASILSSVLAEFCLNSGANHLRSLDLAVFELCQALPVRIQSSPIFHHLHSCFLQPPLSCPTEHLSEPRIIWLEGARLVSPMRLTYRGPVQRWARISLGLQRMPTVVEDLDTYTNRFCPRGPIGSGTTHTSNQALSVHEAMVARVPTQTPKMLEIGRRCRGPRNMGMRRR